MQNINVGGGGKAEIRGMCLNAYGNHLVAAAKDGSITIIDLQLPGKEKIAKQLVQFMGKPGVRVVCWRENPRREIITGDYDGSITVWDFKTAVPVFVMQCHDGPITQLYFYDDL